MKREKWWEMNEKLKMKSEKSELKGMRKENKVLHIF
jgi:hypothetical protein